MTELTEMREEISRAYSSDTPEGTKWTKKVRKMADKQVIAIYLRRKKEERKKNRRKEWSKYPIYAPYETEMG